MYSTVETEVLVIEANWMFRPVDWNNVIMMKNLTANSRQHVYSHRDVS